MTLTGPGHILGFRKPR